MSDERARFLEEESEERIEQDFLAGEIAARLRATYPEPRRGRALTGPIGIFIEGVNLF